MFLSHLAKLRSFLDLESFAFRLRHALVNEVSVLGVHAVVQDTAHAADLDRVVVALAGGAVLRGLVRAALERVLPQQADVALLAPAAAPAPR